MRKPVLRGAPMAIVALALPLIAAACGGNTNASSGGNAGGGAKSPTSAAPAVFKVAVVAPSAVNDLAFTQSMVDALNSLKVSENLQISISDNKFVVDDAANALRTYASQGYNLVIAHGSQYGGTVQQLAPQYPKVSFAWGTAGDTFGQPNVYAYQAASDQGGYVQGVVAAGLTKSDVIGVVGPIEVGDAKLYVDGFKAGVKATNPSVNVKVTYTGSFSDVGLASTTAKSFVAEDADVMTGSAQMVVGAVGVCKTNNVAWFGTQANQTSLAPTVVVSSQVYHWEVALKPIIDAIKGGKLGGTTYTIDLANGGEVIEYNAAYSVPADVKAAGDTAAKGIEDGSIKTGVTG